MSTVYNKEDLYENEIEPKITELKKICNKEKIPMFVSVCTSNDEKKSTYHNDMISPGTHNVVLTDNKIPRFVNVTMGFDTVLPEDIQEIDFD